MSEQREVKSPASGELCSPGGSESERSEQSGNQQRDALEVRE